MCSRRDEHLLLQCALIHAFWCLSQAHIYFHLCLFLHLNGLDCKQRERKRNTMDYSGAIFHIAGNFVINSQQPVTGKSTAGGRPYAAFGSTPSQNGWHTQTAHKCPKDLPKLCRWQQKCYRSLCPYIHLPQDILETARRPYRLYMLGTSKMQKYQMPIHTLLSQWGQSPTSPKRRQFNWKSSGSAQSPATKFHTHFWRQRVHRGWRLAPKNRKDVYVTGQDAIYYFYYYYHYFITISTILLSLPSSKGTPRDGLAS